LPSATREKRGLVAWMIWPGFFLGLWEILLLAQNPDLAADDSGEMIAGSWNLGLPHPPGYPLFDLVGHVFSWLPLGSPAFRYNLLSGLFALGAVLLTARIVLGLARKSLSPFGALALSLGAGTGLFLSGDLFTQALSAKGAVYTSTLLLASLLAGWRVQGDGRRLLAPRAFLILFVWALGLANHWQTVLLWIPFGIHWFWDSRWRPSVKNIAMGLTGVLLGLSPYLYLPLRSRLHPWPLWGDPASFSGFLWVVGRKLVAGSETYFRGAPHFLGTLALEVERLAGSFFPGFWVLVLAGFYFAWREKIRPARALLLILFSVLIAVASVREDQPIDYLLGAYLVSLSGLWLLFGVWGFLGLMGQAQGWPGRVLSAGLGLWFLLGLGSGFFVFEDQGKGRYTLADDFGLNTLRGIPRGGVLVAGGDACVMPVFYDQAVLGKRPDVFFTPDIFLAHDWGWRDDGGGEKTLGGRWAWLLGQNSGTGVFYALGPRYLEPVLQTVPGTWTAQGLARRWAGKGVKPAFDPARLRREMGGERLRGLEPGRLGALDFSSYQILRYYGDQYFQAALESESRGQNNDRLAFLDESLGLFPGNAAACNDLAGFLASQGYWEMALVVLGDALESEPDFKAGWRNRALLEVKEGLDSGALADEHRLLSLGWEGALPSREGVPAPARSGPRPAAAYALLSRRYESQGLLFLAQMARETSRRLSEDPRGDSL